jgi:folate-dependent phosphoribosylglycinamide formyltransferase PurN
MKWIAFFSQTGSEIVELCKEIDRKPDVIVTNNREDAIPYNPGIRELDVVIHIASHDQLMEYFRTQTIHDPKETIITLHGYLRILPPDICEKYDIYNGHPGYITAYPVLKGKDPQKRAWEGKYNWIGCVIHKVTAGVDEGPVVEQTGVPNTTKSLDEMYSKKKQMSLHLWKKFMWGKMNEDSNKWRSISR